MKAFCFRSSWNASTVPKSGFKNDLEHLVLDYLFYLDLHSILLIVIGLVLASSRWCQVFEALEKQGFTTFFTEKWILETFSTEKCDLKAFHTERQVLATYATEKCHVAMLSTEKFVFDASLRSAIWVYFH